MASDGGAFSEFLGPLPVSLAVIGWELPPFVRQKFYRR